MNPSKKYQPTENELEILQILWNRGAATVRDVHQVIEQDKDTGYTTTLKTMQIMIEKGVLTRDTSSRKHVYYPVVSREECQQQFIDKMVDGLFAGSAGRLVMGALDHKKMSSEELSEIKAYLKQFDKEAS